MDRLDDEVPFDGTAGLASAALALARRFAAGGTLWCWSPGAPQHAHHVAVEFVHPVVVGSRALPAVAIPDDDAAPTLRTMARPGDALLVVAGAGDLVASTLHRAQAWGLTTLWVGSGPPPGGATADHRIWLGDDSAAAHDGRLVLGYHVLWELTQVSLEHPGLLEVDVDAPACVTCADEGRLAEVVEVDADDATVRTAAGVETVSTLLVGPVQPGDLVLVHAGTAITVVDP